MTDANVIKPHSLKQERAIFCEKRILLLGTGTQWGKTHVGAIRMKHKLHSYTEKEDAFLITAPTYKILSQSTLPAFLRVMEGWGRYNKQEAVFEMHRGGKVYCRTEKDPDSIVGVTNVRHIWGDEAGKYRLYFWQNMQARADFKGCGIDLTTSPYALNWIYKDLLKPWKAGTRRDDLEVIQAASWENPYHSLHKPEALAAKRATMDLRRFNMIYGGEWGRMEGLVYDCWDDAENFVTAFQLPVGTRYIAGVDWGYNDPFVIKVRAITPDGRHYGVSEFYKSNQTPSDMIQVAQQKKQIFGISKFWCDPSQPGMIAEFNRNGLPAEGAENDIMLGVGVHYDLIKTRKYKEFTGMCPYSADEREQYHYREPKDLQPDQDAKEHGPVDQNNHTMDADRYISVMEARKGEKKSPHVPQERQKEKTRLQYLQNSWKRRQSEVAAE